MPRYSEIVCDGQAENQPGHKRFDKSDLPSWCAHPLTLPPPQPVMLLFPGEQTQYPGMLASCREMPVVRDMLELATEAFEFDVERAMDECGPEDFVDRTDRSQMLAYVADCAALELLKQEQPEVAGRPQAVAGFSVGEFAALVAAKVMSYDQGLIIVKARAEAMQRWVDETEEMASLAVLGLDEERVGQLCAEVRNQAVGTASQHVYISHCWGQIGFACSGQIWAVLELQRLIEAPGSEAVFTQLLERHHDAGHTPLAEGVAKEVEKAIHSIPMNPPSCEVYFNHGYRVPAGEDPSVFLPYLIRQLVTPVRWDGVLRSSLHRGLRRFFECGPGESLKDLMLFNSYSILKEDIRPYDLTTNVRV